MWYLQMPEHVLYGVITFLGLAVIALGAVWVRSHENHRQWITERINEHEKIIAVLEATHRNIERDMSEIKESLNRHLELEEGFQKELLQFVRSK